MRHSLNEIEVTVRKAGIGSGLPVGIAEDIGRAAAWLSARGHDGAGAALTAISRKLERSTDVDFDSDPAALTGGSTAFAGIAAIDLILATVRPVSLEGLDAPLLLAGFAGVAALEHDAAFELTGPSGAIVVEGAGVVAGDPSALSGRIVIAPILHPDAQPDAAGSTVGAEVDEETWAKLAERAARTYVPESDQSRQLGAGAGLLDND